ncbi:MAG: DUF6974 family protein [Candidatus Puniceispirillaceae bacterium]
MRLTLRSLQHDRIRFTPALKAVASCNHCYLRRLPSLSNVFMRQTPLGIAGNVMAKLMNVTVQTFKTENELELSISRWREVQDNFMPHFKDAGLSRYPTSRVMNRDGQFQLVHVFEYRDQDAFDACIPIWKQIEMKWREKIENVTTAYRGALIEQHIFE